jgi:hypothetical protein
MRENRSSGSVEGAVGDRCPYSDYPAPQPATISGSGF